MPKSRHKLLSKIILFSHQYFLTKSQRIQTEKVLSDFKIESSITKNFSNLLKFKYVLGSQAQYLQLLEQVHSMLGVGELLKQHLQHSYHS